MTMSGVGQIPSCKDCRCEANAPGAPVQAQAEIENRIFRDVRELLAKSTDVKLSNPFHFHVLSSHRQQAVSRGHELNDRMMEEAIAFERCIHDAAASVSGSGNAVRISDVLAALNENGRPLPATKGFASFIAIAGQPLAEKPTRLEQFLAIRTACADGFEGVPASIRPIKNCSIYVIDNYLEKDSDLDRTYSAAKQHLGESPGLEDSGAFSLPGAICTVDTAPFLAAEHLEMFELSRQPYTEWLKDLSNRPLGLAFMPLRVLGQYRASGVWLYQGRFTDPENRNLYRHLQAIASTTMVNNAEAWLAPAISHAMLAASSVLLLRAISQFNDLLKTPLWKCELAMRAISNLWYTNKGVGLSHDGLVIRDCGGLEELGTTARSSWNRGERSRTAQIALRVTYDTDISRVLGFDTIGFDCPFIPRDSDLDNEIIRAERVFSDIGSPVVAVRQRALLRQNEEIRRTLDLSAHDYANSLNDLISVTASGENALVAGIDPSAQLLLANSVAKGLLGYAWVQRMSSASAEQQHRTNEGKLIIPFVERDPSRGEIEYWRRWFLQESVYLAYCAFAHAWRMASTSSRVLPTLRYRFWSPVSDSGSAADKTFDELDIGPKTLLSTYSVKEGGQPPWPIPPQVTGQKLGIDGQRAIMMWGARELIRNACRVTWQFAAAQECDPWISVDASISRSNAHWQFRVAVSNPWPPEDAPRSYVSIKSNETIERSISQATFEDAHAPNTASYVYYLKVRNDAHS